MFTDRFRDEHKEVRHKTNCKFVLGHSNSNTTLHQIIRELKSSYNGFGSSSLSLRVVVSSLTTLADENFE